MKRISLLAVAVIFAFASCNKELDSISEVKCESISVSTVVGKPLTRDVITGTVFPTGRSIAISADLNADTGGSGNYFSGLGFSYDDGAWVPASIYYWPLSGSLEMLAYSAGSASVTPSWTNATSVALSCADCSADDILVGGLTAATSLNRTITFSHALAQVKATVSCSAASAVKVKSITINAKKGAVLTASKGAGSSATSVSTVLSGSLVDNTLFSGNQTVTTGAVAAGGAMLLPAQTPGSMTINYTITNNGVESGVMSVTKSLSQAIAAGSSYTYAIAFTLTGITVTASLSDWTPQSSTPVSMP